MANVNASRIMYILALISFFTSKHYALAQDVAESEFVHDVSQLEGGGVFNSSASVENLSKLVPAVQTSDSRGVDLIAGRVRIQVPLVSFGQSGTRMSSYLELTSPEQIGNPYLNPSMDFMQVAGPVLRRAIRPSIGQSVGNFTNVSFPNGAGFYLYATVSEVENPDGSRYKPSIGPSHFVNFISTDPGIAGVYNSDGDVAQSTLGFKIHGIEKYRSDLIVGSDLFERITYADGEEWVLYYQYFRPDQFDYVSRPRFAVSSRGFAIQYLYVSDLTPTSVAGAGAWIAPRRITAYNKAYTFCDEALLQECPEVSSLPSSVDISYDVSGGRVTIRENGAQSGYEIDFPKNGQNQWLPRISSTRHSSIANSSRVFEYIDMYNPEYDYFSRTIHKITDVDGVWNYSHGVSFQSPEHDPYGRRAIGGGASINPNGGEIGAAGYLLFGQPFSMKDELNRHTQLTVDLDGLYRTTSAIDPSGIRTDITRDRRNNITHLVRSPRPDSGGSPMTLGTATFPTDCMNPRTCNRPTSVTDALGNTTNYAYAPQHGGLLTETGPAVGGLRAQKRYAYAQHYAWLKASNGGYVQAARPVWLLTEERTCRTSATVGNACAGGAADEVVVSYQYEAGNASTPSNLLLKGQAVSADGATLRTCYGYDPHANRVWETKPRAALESCL